MFSRRFALPFVLMISLIVLLSQQFALSHVHVHGAPAPCASAEQATQAPEAAAQATAPIADDAPGAAAAHACALCTAAAHGMAALAHAPAGIDWGAAAGAIATALPPSIAVLLGARPFQPRAPPPF